MKRSVYIAIWYSSSYAACLRRARLWRWRDLSDVAVLRRRGFDRWFGSTAAAAAADAAADFRAAYAGRDVLDHGCCRHGSICRRWHQFALSHVHRRSAYQTRVEVAHVHVQARAGRATERGHFDLFDFGLLQAFRLSATVLEPDFHLGLGQPQR